LVIAKAQQQPAARGPAASPLSVEEQQVYRSHGRVAPAAAEAADEGGRVLDLDMAVFEQRSKSAKRGMQAFMLLVMLGLLWGTGYYAWQFLWFEASLLGGLMLFVALLAGVVWWGTMRAAKRATNAKHG
jgi:hypothetical protein